MCGLDKGFTAEVDKIEKDDWNNLLLEFQDASIYQTWSWGVIRWGRENLSHLVLKNNDRIVSIGQLRIMKLPSILNGFAYMNWGPIWRRKNEPANIIYMKNMVKALYSEYVKKRGYILRVLPKIIEDDQTTMIRKIFEEEQFHFKPDPTRTIVMDLTPTIDELRKNLSKSWKRSLNFAEKQNLDIIEGSDDKICNSVLNLSEQMINRKKYYDGDQTDLIAVHKDLPESHKLKINICVKDKEPVAALGWPTIGSIGFPFVGGTGEKALSLKASFLLWWEMIKYYKDNGFIGCDLAGINPKSNPGGYFFKKNLAGKKYQEKIHYIGQFDACENRLAFLLLKFFDSLREFRRILSTKLKKLF